MHLAALEAKVIALVEHVRGGGRAEDDLVELKANWPDPKKWARQLAGMANQVAGPEIVVVIGVDENAHALATPDDIDLQEWWPSLIARFDEDTAPELVNHLTVHLPNGGSVYALAFETNRAPYVVKSLDGTPPHREVPMRSGTQTRWASRSELLRILAPRATTPLAAPLSGRVNITWHGKTDYNEGETITLFAHLTFFLEHISRDYAMLPYHQMAASLFIGDLTLKMATEQSHGSSTEGGVTHGVDVRGDGILATGPGRAYLRLTGSAPLSDRFAIEGARSEQARLVVTMPVVGATLPARLKADLAPQARDIDIPGIQVDLAHYELAREVVA